MTFINELVRMIFKASAVLAIALAGVILGKQFKKLHTK